MATKRELLKKIRQFCSECMGGPRATRDIWPIPNISDVESCTAPECVWYVYRFGKDPEPNPVRVAAGKKLASQMQPGVKS